MRAVYCYRLLTVLAVIFMLGGISIKVQAQDLDKVAPKVLEKDITPTQMPELPVPSVHSSNPERLLLKELHGLIFLRSPEKVLRGGVMLEGILVDGYLPESFFPEMETFLNQPLTLDDLNNILKKVVVYYRTQSTPVVDAYIPEQDITGGTVQVVVVEGRVGQIRSEGNQWFDSKDIESQIRTKPGEVIRGNSLAEDVSRLNQNPFRHVDLVLARGKEKGQTDVILRTEDRFPLRGYIGYENSGNKLTGRDRYLVGFNWGNAFGLGHLLDFQMTSAEKYSRMKAYSLHYKIPLKNHHTVEFSTSYGQSRPNMEPFDLDAKSWEFSGVYRMPLPSIGLLRHELSLGVEYKFSNSDLDFTTMPVFDKKTEVIQATLGYGGSLPDQHGRTAFNLRLVSSPGDLSSHNDNDNFDAYKQGASAQYVYSEFEIDRLTLLPKGFIWNSKAHLQFSDGSLLGSEQLGLGGYSSIRGFEEREANGDEGILLVNEVRTSNYDLTSLLNLPFRAGDLQLLGFWDYGLVRNRNDGDNTALSSLGVGCRYRFGANVSLRFDYGWQHIGANNDKGLNGLGHVGLVIGY